MKKRNKTNFDSRHKARELQPLQLGDTFWIPENKSKGTIVDQSNPRSYTVRIQDGTIRRNRRDLIVLPDPQESDCTEDQNKEKDCQEQTQGSRDSNSDPAKSGTQKTRSGRVSKPPVQLEQNWT